MKLSSLTFLFALIFALAPYASAQTTESEKEAEKKAEARQAAREDFGLERRVNTLKNVSVKVCVASGDVVVRGWDRDEVRARMDESGSLRLLTPNVQPPVSRVEVLVDEDKEQELQAGDCGSTGRLELMLPRGATLDLQVQDGHIEVADVAGVRIKSLSGDVNVRRVSQSIEISCMSGDISLSDSSGGARLSTMSGSVEARNVRTLAAGDDFEAKSASGDVTLEDIGHAQVNGSTISGNVLYEGKLARGGIYDFRTTSGDVMLELPADSSFRLHAKVVVSGDIVTDFPVKTATSVSTSTPSASASASPSASPSASASPTGAPTAPVPTPPPAEAPAPPQDWKGKHKPPRPPKVPLETRLDGIVGTGDAVVTLTSFSGSLHLLKR
jgi:DUF4097 and DUF4098 domain-containing protein YvlB